MDHYSDILSMEDLMYRYKRYRLQKVSAQKVSRQKVLAIKGFNHPLAFLKILPQKVSATKVWATKGIDQPPRLPSRGRGRVRGYF